MHIDIQPYQKEILAHIKNGTEVILGGNSCGKRFIMENDSTISAKGEGEKDPVRGRTKYPIWFDDDEVYNQCKSILGDKQFDCGENI